MINTAMGSHIQKLVESQGRSAAREIEITARARAVTESAKTGIPMTGEEYIESVNPKLHKSLTAGAGRGLIQP
jgi:hypothetical protein